MAQLTGMLPRSSDRVAPIPSPLMPVISTLRAMFGTDALPGLAPGLFVDDETGWAPASDLVNGTRLPDLFDVTRDRLGASPSAAAALSWKAYTYWLALPATLGWAAARRVPLLDPADVLVRLSGDQSTVAVGLRRRTTIAVLPTDPLAAGPPPVPADSRPRLRVVANDQELLQTLRASLLDAHLGPMLDAVHARVRIGARTLLGSVASGVAYGILLAGNALPGSPADNIGTLLATLGIADLIDLVPGPTGALTVRRKTCCLAFTLPRPKICADCCLR